MFRSIKRTLLSTTFNVGFALMIAINPVQAAIFNVSGSTVTSITGITDAGGNVWDVTFGDTWNAFQFATLAEGQQASQALYELFTLNSVGPIVAPGPGASDQDKFDALQIKPTGCSATNPDRCGIYAVLDNLADFSTPSSTDLITLMYGYNADYVKDSDRVMEDFDTRVSLQGAYLGAETAATFANFSTVASTSPVPEPQTFMMLLAGLGLLGFAKRR